MLCRSAGHHLDEAAPVMVTIRKKQSVAHTMIEWAHFHEHSPCVTRLPYLKPVISIGSTFIDRLVIGWHATKIDQWFSPLARNVVPLGSSKISAIVRRTFERRIVMLTHVPRLCGRQQRHVRNLRHAFCPCFLADMQCIDSLQLLVSHVLH